MSLGRGLGALIAPTGGRKKTTLSTGADSSGAKLWSIPVSEIVPNRDQPRREFSAAEIAELAESIKKHGIIQPLVVAERQGGGYELVVGERRLRAARLAGLSLVPAQIKTFADRQRLEVALIENIQRQDLNPIEEAFAYKRLVQEFGLTQEQVAEQVGKSRPAVANAIRLLELPNPVQAALAERKISAGQARALLSLPQEKDVLEMLASLLGQKITVRELEREGARRGAKGKRPPSRNANFSYLEDKLRAELGTKVRIVAKGDGGSVIIDYYSQEELTRLIDEICG